MSYPVQSEPTDALQAEKARAAGWKVDFPRRKCGWCCRDAQLAATFKSCSRHPQCTQAVRDHRADLFGKEATK